MRPSRVALLVTLVAAALRFATHVGRLPPVVASHFGPSGEPDAWMSRGAFACFTLLPLGVVLIVSFLAPLLVEKLPPALINLPNKEYWLTPERRSEATLRFRAYMEWFGV